MALKSTFALISFISSISAGRRIGAVGSRRCSLRGWVQPLRPFEGVRGSIGRGAWSFMTWLRVDWLGRTEGSLYSTYWPVGGAVYWPGRGALGVGGGTGVLEEERRSAWSSARDVMLQGKSSRRQGHSMSLWRWFHVVE